jgi:hypothetical protein
MLRTPSPDDVPFTVRFPITLSVVDDGISNVDPASMVRLFVVVVAASCGGTAGDVTVGITTSSVEDGTKLGVQLRGSVQLDETEPFHVIALLMQVNVTLVAV